MREWVYLNERFGGCRDDVDMFDVNTGPMIIGELQTVGEEPPAQR